MSHATVLVVVKDGTDIESAVEEQMRPFDENGECFKDASRWDWYVIGGRWEGKLDGKNVLQVKNIHPNKFQALRIKAANGKWEAMRNDSDKSMWPLLYGEKADATLESLLTIAKQAWFPSHYAFVKDKRWNERERMGWFGSRTQTECEMKNGKESVRRCKAVVSDAPEAYVVTWNEDYDTWDFKFYDRFIKPLDPTDWLVTVDYHV